MLPTELSFKFFSTTPSQNATLVKLERGKHWNHLVPELHFGHMRTVCANPIFSQWPKYRWNWLSEKNTSSPLNEQMLPTVRSRVREPGNRSLTEKNAFVYNMNVSVRFYKNMPCTITKIRNHQNQCESLMNDAVTLRIRPTFRPQAKLPSRPPPPFPTGWKNEDEIAQTLWKLTG